MTQTRPAPAATLVILGVMGDLSHRLLMPSLINMIAGGLAGDDLSVIGIGRAEGDDESLRRSVENFKAEAGGEGAIDRNDVRALSAWSSLRKRISYFRGDFTDAMMFDRLRAQFEQLGTCNAVFYLATAPRFFGDIVEQLAKAGLLNERKGFRRVAIEKPFGSDHASAQALNRRILALAGEQQIYRIDHFLGKETVRNIMVARFANTLVGSVWNSDYVDHVQITAAETVDVGRRGSFYDTTGALRDMVTNHLFQLLAMVCMEPPGSFDAEAIRDEKAKVFQAIRGPEPPHISRDAVRGAYRAGHIGDKRIGDYRAAPDVTPDSRTETYVALKLAIDSRRWAGVPFYLRTGKALSQRDTEVVVTFKPACFPQFRGTDVAPHMPANKVVIQIEPDEGLAIDFVAKRPGPDIEIAPVRMNFSYADAFDTAHSTGYETLLFDMLMGDQTLFQRADSVEAAWLAVQPVLDAWAAGGEPEPYPAGSAGPEAANALIERDGRRWHSLGR